MKMTAEAPLSPEPDIIDALQRAFGRAGVDVPVSIATLLACLTVIQPSPRRQKRTRGRPAKRNAAWAANIVMTGIEIATGYRSDLPISPFNARPRGLEPVVGEVLALVGIVANPKAAINAALAERQRAVNSSAPGAFNFERGTGAALRRINMLSAMPVPVGPTMPRDRATTH
jgi:hypothetical protein